MKNTLLCSTLLALMSIQVHAEIVQPVNLPSQKAPGALVETPNIPPAPGQNIPSINPTLPKEPTINCDYKIPPEIKKIEQPILLTWAGNAVSQAFNFDPNNLDSQMQKLQPCFTEQGWTGFNTALQKSGNLKAIQTQKLTVSSQVMGEIMIMGTTNDHEWKIKLPLQVVYQNDKEKVTQLLSVDLIVSRKMNGDLGIAQMIAAPKGTVTQDKPQNTDAAPTINSETKPTAPSSNTAPQASPDSALSTPAPSTNPAPTTSTNPSQTTPTTLPNTAPDTQTTPTQPTLTNNPEAVPTPSTPGQPTLPQNSSTQPTLPANNP